MKEIIAPSLKSASLCMSGHLGPGTRSEMASGTGNNQTLLVNYSSLHILRVETRTFPQTDSESPTHLLSSQLANGQQIRGKKNQIKQLCAVSMNQYFN